MRRRIERIRIHTEQIEELLELCWTADEDGLMPLDRDQLPTQLRCFLPSPIEPSDESEQEALNAMIQRGLLTAEGRRIQLSQTGRLQAQQIVRRHRLTEVLLSSVLAVSDASVESTACQVEHILNDEVTEAVCSFLGHPKSCPHGRLIPRGTCCQAERDSLQPLLIPLSQLRVGEEATVVLLHTARHDYLQRLAAFGLTPGRRLHLRQTSPALVVKVGETDLALDRQAGSEIIVRRLISR